jgi:nitrite reductase/ring-hydroxylating ferredoxin subunit
LIILSEENQGNIRVLEAGCVHWHIKKAYIIIISEENHGNIRALEAVCVHWHMKKVYIGNFF